VDATSNAASSWTSSARGALDLDMSQARYGNQKRFGMTAHLGGDAELSAGYSVSSAAAFASVEVQADALIHGEATRAIGDVGCVGADKRGAAHRPRRHSEIPHGDRQWLSCGMLQQSPETVKLLRVSIRLKDGRPPHLMKANYSQRWRISLGMTNRRTTFFNPFGLLSLAIAKKRIRGFMAKVHPECDKWTWKWAHIESG
jgi:hypothetical protein